MTTRILALAAAIPLAVLPAAAKAEATWPAGPLGPIYQIQPDSGGSEVCALGLIDRTMRVVLLKNGGGTVRFTFDANVEWNTGGTVTWDVDGNPFAMKMVPSQKHDFLAFDIEESGVAVDLLHALFNGQTLTVTAGRHIGIFSLTGSATAIAVLNQCRDRLVAQRNGAPPPVAAAPAPTALTLGEAALVDNGHGTFNVRASLNGSAPMSFDLDSGAAGLSIPRHVADQLMAEGRLAPADFSRVITSILADGREVPEQLYVLKSVTIAGRTVYDVPCIVGDNDSLMLIGQSVLKKFKSWTIDNERHVLVLN